MNTQPQLELMMYQSLWRECDRGSAGKYNFAEFGDWRYFYERSIGGGDKTEKLPEVVE